MTTPEFNELFEETTERTRELFATKGPDYCDGDDRLSNFKLVAKLVGGPVTPEIVWAVYAAKHFFAIMNYCGKGKVESEPIEGRIDDLIAYAHLFKGIVAEEKERNRPIGERIDAINNKIIDEGFNAIDERMAELERNAKARTGIDETPTMENTAAAWTEEELNTYIDTARLAELAKGTEEKSPVQRLREFLKL